MIMLYGASLFLAAYMNIPLDPFSFCLLPNQSNAKRVNQKMALLSLSAWWLKHEKWLTSISGVSCVLYVSAWYMHWWLVQQECSQATIKIPHTIIGTVFKEQITINFVQMPYGTIGLAVVIVALLNSGSRLYVSLFGSRLRGCRPSTWNLLHRLTVFQVV